jgi:hypothetical protein
MDRSASAAVLPEVTEMKRLATDGWAQSDRGTPFTREDILGILDGAPDGYKLLARLVDDPYELLRDYDPNLREKAPASPGNGHARTQFSRLEAQLSGWLAATLRQRGCRGLGGVPSN